MKDDKLLEYRKAMFEGWICEWYGNDAGVNINSNYGASNYHTFYLSKEL